MYSFVYTTICVASSKFSSCLFIIGSRFQKQQEQRSCYGDADTQKGALANLHMYGQ